VQQVLKDRLDLKDPREFRANRDLLDLIRNYK
jgi:hypothetical protein